MKRMWACIAAAFLVALMAAPVSASTMAPSYVSSEPSDGEELHRAPDRVEVTFSEPLDESSKLSVKDSCGRDVDDGRVAVDGNTITVGISLQPSGHYQVSYTATGIAGVTGSTDGGFHFMVHFGEKCDGGKKGGGHNNHGGNENEGDNHNEHEGGGGGNEHTGGGNHSEPEHTAMGSGGAHSATTDHTGGHAGSDNSTDKRHQGMHGGDHKERTNKHGKHRKPKVTVDDPSDGRTIAAGPGQPVAPDGRAVMFALAFSLVLGSVGGWFLRVSAAR